MAENLALSSEPVGRRSRSRRRSSLRRALRTVFRAAILLAALPLVLLPLYAVVDPPVSTVMLWKSLGGAAINKQWTDLENISPNLVRAVLASEDARFCEHNGIDWVEMEKAMADDDGRPRGASTITMQTVKNLFLWTQRSWIRKGLEFPLALYAELVLSKKRIVEIYLNIAELGDGIYGAAAASEHYFGVGPAKLSKAQAAQLAAILPAPLARSAAKPGRQTRAAARRIAGRAAASGGYFGCVLD
jgi:monofunctional biosynthetic peptidoglycan transglycosylase